MILTLFMLFSCDTSEVDYDMASASNAETVQMSDPAVVITDTEPIQPEGIPIYFITAEEDSRLQVRYKGLTNEIEKGIYYFKPGSRYNIILSSIDGQESSREYRFYEEWAGETFFISHEKNEYIIKNIPADVQKLLFDGISLKNNALVTYNPEKQHVPVSYVVDDKAFEYILPVGYLLKNNVLDCAHLFDAIENGTQLGLGQSEAAVQLNADWLAAPAQSMYMNTFRYRETDGGYGDFEDQGPEFIKVGENQILRNLAIVNPTDDIIGAELELTVGNQLKVISITDEVYDTKQRAESYFYGPNVEFELPGMLEIPFQTVDLLPPFSTSLLHVSLKKNGQVISENSFTASHFNRRLNRDIGIYNTPNASAFESPRPAVGDEKGNYYLHLKNNPEFTYVIVFEEVMNTVAYKPVLIKEIIDSPDGPAIFSFDKEAFEGDLFFLAVKDLNDMGSWTTVFAGPVSK